MIDRSEPMTSDSPGDDFERDARRALAGMLVSLGELSDRLNVLAAAMNEAAALFAGQLGMIHATLGLDDERSGPGSVQ